jgi:hypothetical protein
MFLARLVNKLVLTVTLGLIVSEAREANASAGFGVVTGAIVVVTGRVIAMVLTTAARVVGRGVVFTGVAVITTELSRKTIPDVVVTPHACVVPQ